MYQVLLVDDEESVIDSLKKSIDWAAYDLTVAAVAFNGADAISIIQTGPIDIVITDIRMNRTGGLELCQYISLHHKSIQMIIMSGYAEFSYAQKAIGYGVLGYCLKPLEYTEICRHLVHAVQRLKATANLPDYDDLLDALDRHHPENVAAALTNLGYTEPLCHAAVSVGESPINLPHGGLLLRLGRRQYAYISKQPIHDQNVEAYLQNSQNNSFCSFAEAVPIGELSGAINRLSLDAFQFFINPISRHIREKAEDRSAALLNKASGLAAFGDPARMLTFLSELSAGDRNRFTIRSALRLYNIVYSVLLSPRGEANDIYSPEQLVSQYTDFSSMLAALCRKLSEDAVPPVQNQISNSSFIQMMAYINSRYNQDISLSQIAADLHFNASYLSQTFKKETGENFSKYLTDLRIKKAKELLDSGTLSISEVAMEVGFNDYFYFLKIFKRCVGQTPKQYRMGYGQIPE